MNYVETYMSLHPEDEVVVKGGAAAYLVILDRMQTEIPLRDIDVSINTTSSVTDVLTRWMQILPPEYTSTRDATILTFTDTRGVGISLDIFVNEDRYTETILVGKLRVERLDTMVNTLRQEVVGRKKDIEFLNTGIMGWSQEQIDGEIEKYNRMLSRLQLIEQCLKR